MGGGNPVSAVVNTVSNAVNTAVVQPVSATVEATKKVMTGDVQGAATAVGGALLNNNPINQAINVGGEPFKQVLNTKEANNITLGLSGDAVRATQAQNDLVNGEALTGQRAMDIGIYNAKAATLATAGGYALNSGLAAKAGTWALSHPVEGLAAGTLLAQGKGSQLVPGIVNNYLPGAGNLVDPILNPPPTRAPASDTSPSTGAPGAAWDNFTVGGIDSTTKLALGGAFAVVLLVVIKKLKR